METDDSLNENSLKYGGHTVIMISHINRFGSNFDRHITMYNTGKSKYYTSRISVRSHTFHSLNFLYTLMKI